MRLPHLGRRSRFAPIESPARARSLIRSEEPSSTNPVVSPAPCATTLLKTDRLAPLPRGCSVNEMRPAPPVVPAAIVERRQGKRRRQHDPQGEAACQDQHCPSPPRQGGLVPDPEMAHHWGREDRRVARGDDYPRGGPEPQPLGEQPGPDHERSYLAALDGLEQGPDQHPEGDVLTHSGVAT